MLPTIDSLPDHNDLTVDCDHGNRFNLCPECMAKVGLTEEQIKDRLDRAQEHLRNRFGLRP